MTKTTNHPDCDYVDDARDDCQCVFQDVTDDIGRTFRTCKICRGSVGEVQADGSVLVDGIPVAGHHTTEHLQAIDGVLDHVQSRVPSLFDVLTIAGISNVLPVNDVQRDAINEFIASIHKLRAADSRFEKCKRAVARSFGIDRGCPDDIPF